MAPNVRLRSSRAHSPSPPPSPDPPPSPVPPPSPSSSSLLLASYAHKQVPSPMELEEAGILQLPASNKETTTNIQKTSPPPTIQPVQETATLSEAGFQSVFLDSASHAAQIASASVHLEKGTSQVGPLSLLGLPQGGVQGAAAAGLGTFYPMATSAFHHVPQGGQVSIPSLSLHTPPLVSFSSLCAFNDPS